MLVIILLLVTFSFSAVGCEEHRKIDANEPLILTVSPKLWNLLETKANIISDTIKSITFPEFSGKAWIKRTVKVIPDRTRIHLKRTKKGLLKYRIWDGRVEHFSLPKSGVSFQDMSNGIHLSMKDVQFHASVRGRLEIGKKIFGKWVRLARMSGHVKGKSENANLDLILKWNDFKFVPTVSMNSNVRVDFTDNLRKLNFLRKKVQKMVTSKANSEVPKKIVEAIERQVNPRLQKLKEKMISMGFAEYDIEWTVQNNILRVTVKPKSGKGSVSPVIPIDNMLCVNGNVLAVINAFPPRVKRAATTTGIEFTCVAPKFSCKGVSCSLCTDIDINPAAVNSTDKFHNCMPSF